MRHPNIASLDLNLLKTFLAIWELRNLTATADRLHLTQPAVSHALKRLREIFDDPLFVRTPSTMAPTDAAIRLHTPIQEALTIIDGALQKHAHFDPRTASRNFRIVMSDISASHVLPQLLKRVTACAPNISFDVQQMPIEMLTAAMRNGDVDMAFGYLPGLGEDCIAENVLVDAFVCILRRDHPLQKRALSVEDLGRLRYVYAATSTTGHRLADEVFRDAGIERDIALRLAHFTIAPQIVRDTDLALILPRSIAERMNSAGEFMLLDVPLPLPKIPVRIHIHSRFAADPGLIWLRSELVEMFARPRDFA